MQLAEGNRRRRHLMVRRNAVSLGFVLFTSTLTGCQGLGQSQPIEGASEYNLGGREINPPNQVRVDNPYSFPVKIVWQDKEIILPPHSQRLIIFEGLDKPGSIRVWKIDANDAKKLTELTYATKTAGLIGARRVYRVQ
jgi:hypothetical protein